MVITAHKRILLILILLILPSIVLAADVTPTPPANPLNDPVLRLVITENLKTREDLKTYMDTSVNTATTNLQKSVDDNFKVLDQRLNDFAMKLAIKLGIVVLASAFLAIISAELVSRRVYDLALKNYQFQEENQPQTRITPDLQTKMVAIYDALVLKGAVPTDDTINELKLSQQQTQQQPRKQGFFEQRKQQKQQATVLKRQQEQTAQNLRLIQQHTQLQQQLRALEAQIQPVPAPAPTIQQEPESTKTPTERTQDRIHAEYERQKINELEQYDSDA